METTGSPISMCDYSEKILKINKIPALLCSLCCFVSPVLVWGGSSELFMSYREVTKQHKEQGKAGIL